EQNGAAADSLAGMGERFAEGNGVPKDQEKAAKCFQRAAGKFRQRAEEGDGDAQIWLGNLYARGFGVPQSFAETTKWFNNALTNFDSSLHTVSSRENDVENALIDLINQGTNAPEITTLYLLLKRRAAERGDPSDQWGLGLIYEQGDLAPQD